MADQVIEVKGPKDAHGFIARRATITLEPRLAGSSGTRQFWIVKAHAWLTGRRFLSLQAAMRWAQTQVAQ